MKLVNYCNNVSAQYNEFLYNNTNSLIILIIKSAVTFFFISGDQLIQQT